MASKYCVDCGEENDTPIYDSCSRCFADRNPTDYNQPKEKVVIGEMCDGWQVNIKGKEYSWNHNDEDMGTKGLKEMLTDLGFDVKVEEWY